MSTLTPEPRLAALEAEVADLRAYIPMLARLALYERDTGASMPELVHTVRDVFAAVASILHDHSSWAGCALDSPAHVIEPAPGPFRRPEGEPLPRAAQVLAHDLDHREPLPG